MGRFVRAMVQREIDTLDKTLAASVGMEAAASSDIGAAKAFAESQRRTKRVDD